MKKKNEIKYNNWSEYLTNTRDRTNYAIRRMDLLIISICGASIYIIFETFREIGSGILKLSDPSVLQISGITFLFSILVNFASQITGFHANNNEEKYILLELRKIEGKSIVDKDKDCFDKLSRGYTKATSILNSSSIVLMLVGLSLLVYFYYFKLF